VTRHPAIRSSISPRLTTTSETSRLRDESGAAMGMTEGEEEQEEVEIEECLRAYSIHQRRRRTSLQPYPLQELV